MCTERLFLGKHAGHPTKRVASLTLEPIPTSILLELLFVAAIRVPVAVLGNVPTGRYLVNLILGCKDLVVASLMSRKLNHTLRLGFANDRSVLAQLLFPPT